MTVLNMTESGLVEAQFDFPTQYSREVEALYAEYVDVAKVLVRAVRSLLDELVIPFVARFEARKSMTS